MKPIWKDYYVDLGTGAYADFSVLMGSSVIYTGRAYKRPGATKIEVRINDIVADYLDIYSPFDEDITDMNTCTIQVKVGSTTKATETFYNDWSYRDNFDYDTYGLSFPIDGYVDLRQHLLFSDPGWGGGGAEVYTEAEITYNSPRPDFLATDFNRDFLISADSSNYELGGEDHPDPRTFCIDLSNSAFIGAETIKIGGRTWRVANTCADFVLHYINAFGAWDSFLVRGNGKAADGIKHYERQFDYNNRNLEARGRENYVNELTRKFTLHSGVLTEDQSLRMHHLLDSTCVYLEDLAEGTIRPVVLTGNNCEYKTYRNNGRKLMEYTIEAELAQDRMRR